MTSFISIHVNYSAVMKLCNECPVTDTIHCTQCPGGTVSCHQGSSGKPCPIVSLVTYHLQFLPTNCTIVFGHYDHLPDSYNVSCSGSIQYMYLENRL